MEDSKQLFTNCAVLLTKSCEFKFKKSNQIVCTKTFARAIFGNWSKYCTNLFFYLVVVVVDQKSNEEIKEANERSKRLLVLVL